MADNRILMPSDTFKTHIAVSYKMRPVSILLLSRQYYDYFHRITTSFQHYSDNLADFVEGLKLNPDCDFSRQK